MSRRAILRISCVLSVAALVVAPMTAAWGEEAEIAVSNYAWYWKSQQSQPVTDPTSGADVVSSATTRSTALSSWLPATTVWTSPI